MIKVLEDENRELHAGYLSTMLHYKIAWDKELRRRQKLGITGLPEPPHQQEKWRS